MTIEKLQDAISGSQIPTREVRQEIAKALELLKVIGKKELSPGGEYMSNYLSATETEIVLKIGAMAAEIEVFVAAYQKVNRCDKRFLNLLELFAKIGELTFMQRVLHLDQDGKDKMQEKISKHTVRVGLKKDREKEIKEDREINKSMVFTEEEIFNWVEVDIENFCCKCENSGQEIKDCVLRKTWIRHDVAPLYIDCDEDKCPFMYGEEWKELDAIGDIGIAYLQAMREAKAERENIRKGA